MICLPKDLNIQTLVHMKMQSPYKVQFLFPVPCPPQSLPKRGHIKSYLHRNLFRWRKRFNVTLISNQGSKLVNFFNINKEALFSQAKHLFIDSWFDYIPFNLDGTMEPCSHLNLACWAPIIFSLQVGRLEGETESQVFVHSLISSTPDIFILSLSLSFPFIVGWLGLIQFHQNVIPRPTSASLSTSLQLQFQNSSFSSWRNKLYDIPIQTSIPLLQNGDA